MGLFSNKKAQADGFSFAVDEVYALKEGKSVVVTGKMTSGKVTPGTAAICLDEEGKPAFPLATIRRECVAGEPKFNEDSLLLI